VLFYRVQKKNVFLKKFHSNLYRDEMENDEESLSSTLFHSVYSYNTACTHFRYDVVWLLDERERENFSQLSCRMWNEWFWWSKARTSEKHQVMDHQKFIFIYFFFLLLINLLPTVTVQFEDEGFFSAISSSKNFVSFFFWYVQHKYHRKHAPS
jgi:hypothetical protein